MLNPFDRLCRFLAKLTAEAFLRWLLRPGRPSLRFQLWLDTQNIPFPSAPIRRCDTVAFVINDDAGGEPWAIVLEFQTEPDFDMLLRLLAYECQVGLTLRPTAHSGDRFSLGSILVQLTGTRRPSLHSVWPATGLETHKRIHVRNFAEESATATLAGIADGSVPPIALAFIPLMQAGDQPATVAEWKRLGLLAPETLRADVAAGAVVFAQLTNCRPVWKSELKEWNMLRSEQVDEWQADARREVEEKAILVLYQTVCELGHASEQARQTVVKKFGANATVILDRLLAQPAN
jgi:hypothetical protein